MRGVSLGAGKRTLVIREATAKDMPGIESLPADKQDQRRQDERNALVDLGGSRLELWTVGITAHEDCVELTGLTVDPLYRGRGLGHANWWNSHATSGTTRNSARNSSQVKKIFLNDKLWLLTPSPGYFLPANFVMTDNNLLPQSIKDQMTGPRTRWFGMRYQLYKL